MILKRKAIARERIAFAAPGVGRNMPNKTEKENKPMKYIYRVYVLSRDKSFAYWIVEAGCGMDALDQALEDNPCCAGLPLRYEQIG